MIQTKNSNMAITHISLVNQKLAYVKALEALLVADEHGLSRLQQQALIDACVFHLVSAYRFYLRELGENYRVKNLALINNIEQLIIALNAIDKSPSEAAEIAMLEAEAESWLASLLSYYDLLQQSPVAVKEAKAFPSDGLIQVVDLTETPSTSASPLTTHHITAALNSFRHLIQRQRETSAEY